MRPYAHARACTWNARISKDEKHPSTVQFDVRTSPTLIMPLPKLVRNNNKGAVSSRMRTRAHHLAAQETLVIDAYLLIRLIFCKDETILWF